VLAVAASLTVFGTLELVHWGAPSDPYGTIREGTGK
jgi:hypothetical protein